MSRLKRWMLRSPFGAEKRIEIYRNMMSLMTKGTPLMEALLVCENIETEDGLRPKAGLAEPLRDWRNFVRRGRQAPFGSALEGWVPEVERQLIVNGEISGSTALGLRYALMIARNGNRVQKRIQSKGAYPMLMFLVAYGVALLLSTKMVPVMSTALPRGEWPPSAQALGLIADLLIASVPYVLVGIPSIIAFFVVVLPRYRGAFRLWLDHNFLPFKLYRMVNGSAFLLGYVALNAAGVPANTIIANMTRYASPWLRQRLMAVDDAFAAGAVSLGDALTAAGYRFPDPRMVATLRALGSNLQEVGEGGEPIMVEIAKEWIEQIEVMVDRSMNQLKAFAMLFLFGIIILAISGMGAVTFTMLDKYGF